MDLRELENLTLETLITKNRDRFFLRYSTESDLEIHNFSDSKYADGRAVKSVLKGWRFITFEDTDQNVRATFLTGAGDNGFVMTSRVIYINSEQGWVVTQSGSLYVLDGQRLQEPFDLHGLMFVSSTFNLWGVGPRLGMPPAFF